MPRKGHEWPILAKCQGKRFLSLYGLLFQTSDNLALRENAFAGGSDGVLSGRFGNRQINENTSISS